MNDSAAKGSYLIFIILGIVLYTLLTDSFSTLGVVLSVAASMIIAKIFQTILK